MVAMKTIFIHAHVNRYDITISEFEERGVKVKTEADGRMFPDTDNSQTIIDALMREANRYGVDIRMNANVQTISQTDRGFKLLYDEREIDCQYVCIASGGYPKSIQFNWLKELGHTIADPIPSLFTFNLPAHPINALMGVSVANVRVKIEGSKLVEEGPLLITHWGLSGPAILRLSAKMDACEKAPPANVSIRPRIPFLELVMFSDRPSGSIPGSTMNVPIR